MELLHSTHNRLFGRRALASDWRSWANARGTAGLQLGMDEHGHHPFTAPTDDASSLRLHHSDAERLDGGNELVSVLEIPMLPKQTIAKFDTWLGQRGKRLDALVIGGAALNLLGLVSRPTKDFDILVPVLSGDIAAEALAFAAEIRKSGEALGDDWLNNGPASLTADLPPGWLSRQRAAFDGTAIKLTTLGREDLLKTKLFALCDRALDFADCVAMAPTADELRDALPWLEVRDANSDWPAHVRATLAGLAKGLGYAL